MSFVKNTVYSFVDLLSLGKGIPTYVNDYEVRFPAKWARYFEKDYERDNIQFLSKNCIKNMTVIDIGAHLGLMSVIISKLVGDHGKVYSFEPTERTFETLKEIVRINKASHIIHPFNQAVSSFDGEVDFFVDQHEGSNANSLVSRSDKSRTTQKTSVTRLDTFTAGLKLNRLDLIKIDAEGSEMDVLKGAMQTISAFRPKIILAIHPSLVRNNNQEPGDIFDLITGLDYTVYYKTRIMSKDTFKNTLDFFDVHLIPNR
jgi:FkbM family methyltransferase